MHVAKCKKISRVGFRHDRVVILSTHNIFMVSSKGASKILPIIELKYIVKSLVSNELLLYFDQSYDIRMILESRIDFLALINLRFALLCP